MILIILDIAQVIIAAFCASVSGYRIVNLAIGENLDIGRMTVLLLVYFISAVYFTKGLICLFKDLDK